MASSLRLQTLALLGQEFLAQALVRGGSLNDVVAEALIKPKAKTGRETSAAALTGRIRSDSAMVRQASRNAAEASTMATMIKDAAFSVSETLNSMLTIAQAVNNNEISAADAAESYNSLAASLKSTIAGTSYNGISLLDKEGWGNDARVAEDASGTSGSIDIQMGNASSPFTMRDLSGLKAFAAATDFDPATIANTIGTLSAGIDTANTMSSGYEALASSYAAEAKHFEFQADNLALAAARAQFAPTGKDEGAAEAAGNILLDILLRDQGKLVDRSS